MTPSEFHRRAFAAGCQIRTSGRMTFYSRNIAQEGQPDHVLSVRLSTDDKGTAHYAVADLTHGQDIGYKPTTVAQASKALRLPRR